MSWIKKDKWFCANKLSFVRFKPQCSMFTNKYYSNSNALQIRIQFLLKRSIFKFPGFFKEHKLSYSADISSVRNKN